MNTEEIERDISRLERDIAYAQIEIGVLYRTAKEALAGIRAREQLIAPLEDKLEVRRRQLKEKA